MAGIVSFCVAASVVVAFMCGRCLGQSAPVVGDLRALLVGVADAYQLNREAFDEFSCEFQVAVGEVRSFPQALSGQIENPTRGTGRWLVHGDKALFELLCDPAAAREFAKSARKAIDAGKSGSTHPLPSVRYLLDGQAELRYSELGGGGNLFSAEHPSDGLLRTPFDMGLMGRGEARNPARCIREALDTNGHVAARYLTDEEDGKQRLRIELGPAPGQVQTTFTLDPTRGYVLLEMSRHDISKRTRTVTLNVTGWKACEGSRWFPERYVAVTFPDRREGPYHTFVSEVTRLQLGSPPLDDMFINLPVGTVVSITGRRGAQIHVGAKRKVILESLPALWTEIVAAGEAAQARDRARAAARPLSAVSAIPDWKRLTAIVALATALSAVTFVVLRRWQRVAGQAR